MKHPLTRVHAGSIPPEGVISEGEIDPRILDLLDDDRIAFPNPASYSFKFSVVSGSFLAQGKIELCCRCRCDRCLVYFNFDVGLADLCYYIPVKEDDTVDLTDPIRQDILLFFPQRLICDPDCRGLCDRCGQNLNVRNCECQTGGKIQSQWKELDNLNLPDE